MDNQLISLIFKYLIGFFVLKEVFDVVKVKYFKIEKKEDTFWQDLLKSKMEILSLKSLVIAFLIGFFAYMILKATKEEERKYYTEKIETFGLGLSSGGAMATAYFKNRKKKNYDKKDKK